MRTLIAILALSLATPAFADNPKPDTKDSKDTKAPAKDSKDAKAPAKDSKAPAKDSKAPAKDSKTDTSKDAKTK